MMYCYYRMYEEAILLVKKASVSPSIPFETFVEIGTTDSFEIQCCKEKLEEEMNRYGYEVYFINYTIKERERFFGPKNIVFRVKVKKGTPKSP